MKTERNLIVMTMIFALVFGFAGISQAFPGMAGDEVAEASDSGDTGSAPAADAIGADNYEAPTTPSADAGMGEFEGPKDIDVIGLDDDGTAIAPKCEGFGDKCYDNDGCSSPCKCTGVSGLKRGSCK